MANPPKSFRLPEGLTSVADPVERNPFRIGDPRHAVWNEATLVAEQEVCRAGAALLAAITPATVLDCDEALVIAKFDAWAKRAISVVWSEEAVKAYGRWLLSYANGWLDEVARSLESAPSGFPAESMLIDLRGRLAGRVQHWKAEARRYRADQQVRAHAPLEIPASVSASVVIRRKAALRKYRHDNDLTAAGFALRVGISQSAIEGIVKEDRKRFSFDTRDRLLRALSLSLEEWYGL